MPNKKFFIKKDISLAKTMPSEFYLDKNYFNISLEKIFKASWQIITDIDQIGNNTIFPFIFYQDTIDDPLILTIKGKDINCLSNVCTHRGSLLCKSKKNIKSIKCKYHGRTFGLNGIVKSTPGFEGIKNFPTENDNLKQCKIIKWKQFILTSIDPKINLDAIFTDINKQYLIF